VVAGRAGGPSLGGVRTTRSRPLGTEAAPQAATAPRAGGRKGRYPSRGRPPRRCAPPRPRRTLHLQPFDPWNRKVGKTLSESAWPRFPAARRPPHRGLPRRGAAAMMPAMPRKIVFIVNPKSRGGSTGRDWPALAGALRAQVGDFGTYYTKKPMEAVDLTRHALSRGADVVVAVGGDGTTNEVVNGFFHEDGTLVRPGATMAVLPRGTGSDFLRSFTVD